jgi:hypothetical protein
MAIIYAGGTLVNQLHTSITTQQGLLDAINTSLVAAGWTSTPAKPYTTAVFTGQPNNGDTITVDAQVYTFNTVLGGANSILIDATAYETYENLKNALNGGPGSGTKYGTGTSVNATMEGGRLSGGGASGYLIIQRKVGGYFTSPGVLESVTNMSLTIAGSILGGGYVWTSATTPQGLRVAVYGADYNENANPPYNLVVRMIGMNAEQSIVSNDYYNGAPNNPFAGGRLALGISSSWRVIANRYMFIVKGEGVPPSTELAWFHAGAVSIYPPTAPTVIQAVANSTPIAITTATAHGLTSGDNVCVRGTGLPGADINGVATVTGATTFTLNGTTQAGTSATGVVGKIGSQVAEFCFCTMGDGSVKFAASQLTADSTYYWTLLNGSTGGGGGSSSGGTGVLACVVGINAATDRGANPTLFYSGQALTSEPLVGSGNTAGGNFYIIGQMFSAIVVMQSLPMDQAGSFDGHNWFNLTDSNTGSAGSAEASLLVEVP